MFCVVVLRLSGYNEFSDLKIYGGFDSEEAVDSFVKLRIRAVQSNSGETVYYRLDLEDVGRVSKGQLYNLPSVHSYNLAPKGEIVWQDTRYDLG